ncbi:MAG: stage II sporulation protein M [Dysgonamonadaceae bacterium]|jgi:uncharacterized membrane protein SpoIIM required for sporulation|nr:stage II sporulation protein M [Dysgonamonadaceae bacterium]
MKEAIFIRQNKEKWKNYEDCLLKPERQSPDILADIYIDVTNDLSFARSQYPSSKITGYLNGLSSKLHQFIHKRKKEKFSRIITYWTQEIPEVMYLARKELLYSFIIFATSILVGAFSAANDKEFVRIIMGDMYVDMTLQNIKNDDPMAVYKSMNESIMFYGITLNNIGVSFKVFAAGLFTSLATAYMLLTNGIMLGSFQYFFYEHGLLQESFLTIWIHGTLEISAIIVAGAAGLTMGNGWLFPKTLTRIESFKRGAKRGAKIVIGTIPIFIVAGFLESYVTRHTELPDYIRLLIILLSLYFVIAYYVIYPRMLAAPKSPKGDLELDKP